MLSEKDCKAILKNYLKRDDFKFRSFKLGPISEDAEGFMGEHYKLQITHETDTLRTEQFFLKVKPTKNQFQQDMAKGYAVYKREIFVYETLLKEFDKYGLDTSFASTSYYCLPDTALVLKDMALSGFALTERHEDFSLEHVRCALSALAAFHACGFAYEQIKTKESRGCAFRLGDYYKEYLSESFYVQFANPDAYGMKWWRGNRKTILKFISLLDGDERFSNFENLYSNYEFGKVFVEDTGISKTCGHGDLWTNNLMFKYDGNIPIKCCLLDFQIVRYFYPSLDVILVIFYNTNSEFRKLHLNSLYKYYFDTLSTCLSKYGYSVQEIHPWDDFLRSIELLMPDAIYHVFSDSCIINLPKQKISNTINKEEGSLSDLLFDNSEIAAHAFNTDNIYKEKMLEILGLLYDVLAKKV